MCIYENLEFCNPDKGGFKRDDSKIDSQLISSGRKADKRVKLKVSRFFKS